MEAGSNMKWTIFESYPISLYQSKTAVRLIWFHVCKTIDKSKEITEKDFIHARLSSINFENDVSSTQSSIKYTHTNTIQAFFCMQIINSTNNHNVDSTWWEKKQLHQFNNSLSFHFIVSAHSNCANLRRVNIDTNWNIECVKILQHAIHPKTTSHRNDRYTIHNVLLYRSNSRTVFHLLNTIRGIAKKVEHCIVFCWRMTKTVSMTMTTIENAVESIIIYANVTDAYFMQCHFICV